jgi:Domain of unknown function (DUF5666)/Domain of unknown function (DUF4382)
MKLRTGCNTAAVFALFGVLVIMTGCGGGGGGSAVLPPVVGPSPSGSTLSVVNFADSPSDRVVAFELTVNSVMLTRSDNSTVVLLSSPRRVELTHVSGSAEPLVVPSIPQGTYSSATLVVSAPDVVYIDNSGHEVEKKDTTATKTLNIVFNPALVVGATPVVLTIDVDARGSLTIDTVTGNVTVNPVATVGRSNISENENEQEVENGEFEHIVGQVSASSANEFTITIGVSGTTLTFTTNSSTSFEGAAGASSLTAGTLVKVEGRTQSDGTMLAKEVEVISANGTEAEGLITATTGNPVSAFDLVLQDGSGSGMNSSSLGAVMRVNIDNSTKFRIDEGKIDLSGLSLPAFSAGSLSKGQRVEAESDNPAVNGVLAAESVKLQSQALVGAVSANTSSQFTLTLPDDSAFKLLTGKNTLTVFTQRNTELKNGAAVTQGSVVKVRGLVFFDPNQGSFMMVAGRITTP